MENYSQVFGTLHDSAFHPWMKNFGGMDSVLYIERDANTLIILWMYYILHWKHTKIKNLEKQIATTLCVLVSVREIGIT